MTIMEDGATLPARTILNFAEGLIAVDNPLNNRIDVVASPIATRYLRPGDFGAVGDVVWITDGVTTNGSATFTSASAAFTASDVGKRISIQGAGSSSAALHTTITARNSATNVTLGAAAGTSLTNAICSYATDCATQLQTWLDNLTPTTPGYLDRFYASSLQLNINQSCTIIGAGVYGVYGNYGDGTTTGHGPGVPWTVPYLAGAGFHIMASGLTSAIKIPNQATVANLSNFGIIFAAPFFSTGHGIYAPGGDGLNTGVGVPNATWNTVWVFGNDGNSYAFKTENSFQNFFAHLRNWGGGFFEIIQNQSGWAYGNQIWLDCASKIFVSGTADAWKITNTNAVPNQFSLVLPGFNAVTPSKYGFSTFNGRAISGPTSSQKLANFASGSVQGLSLIAPTWDAASTSIAAPVFPNAAASKGGQFIDPGGFFDPLTSFNRMFTIPTGLGGANIPDRIRNIFTRTASATLTSNSDGGLEVCDATSGAIVLTLPALSASKGMVFTAKKTDAGGNAVSFARAGADTIDGATSKSTTTQYATISVMGGASEWHVI